MVQPEPWLRGSITDVHPVQAAVLYSYTQVREDLRKWTGGISDEEVWQLPLGLASLGFQLRHIAGSVDRLTTYLNAGQLNEEQFIALRAEMRPGASLKELLDGVDKSLAASEKSIRRFTPDQFPEPRGVGRRLLPTTVAGLLVHLAEHTQRHLGQAIMIAKILKATR